MHLTTSRSARARSTEPNSATQTTMHADDDRNHINVESGNCGKEMSLVQVSVEVSFSPGNAEAPELDVHVSTTSVAFVSPSNDRISRRCDEV